MTVRSRTALALAAGVVLGFSISLTGNVLAERPADPPAGSARHPDGLPWEDARLLAEVMERVRREYVTEVDEHVLMESAIRGMVAALDPHSTFLDSDEYEDMRLSTTGTYPGVGIEVAAEADGIKVLRPIPGSPAETAGVLAGDLIVRIDGTPLRRGDLEDAIERMRGSSGTKVRLTVQRESLADPIEFELERAQVEVQSVSAAMLQPGYAYVRIAHFNESTAKDLGRTLARLRAREPALRGLVLDLRNNPGGVLEAGVDVADAFLEEGLIVSADGRTADARFRMHATPGDLVDGAPIAVLVNGGSASASEIVAGALHDHQRATLVGRTTYGKGSVQTVMPLSQGRAIKLTTSRYYTPSGASIQDKGLVPNVVLEGAEGAPVELAGSDAGVRLLAQDREVRAALEVLTRQHPLTIAHAEPCSAARE